MDLAHGGHLTHGMKLNFSGKYFHIVGYGVRQSDERIDIDQVAKLAREHKPKPPTVAKPVLKIAGNGSVFEEGVAPPPRMRIDPRVWQPLPSVTPVTFMDRARGQCAWPLEGLMCCGDTVVAEGKPYCATHTAWAKPKPQAA